MSDYENGSPPQRLSAARATGYEQYRWVVTGAAASSARTCCKRCWNWASSGRVDNFLTGHRDNLEQVRALVGDQPGANSR
jgi:hypothetical protein